MYPSNISAINDTYPTYAGNGGLGEQVTSPFGQSSPGGNFAGSGKVTPADAADAKVSNALNVGSSGSATMSWVALAAMLIGLMYFAQRYDGDGSYSNLRLSAYNIFTISLAAVIGITLFKQLFTHFPVPGVSTVVLGV
jgi:hypothetical protein